jgi:anthranilate phosphoribosyltransferase
MIEAVLAGSAPAEARNAVVLNAAAAIYVSGLAADIGAAVEAAIRALDSGAARDVLSRLRAASPRRPEAAQPA